MLLEFVVRSGFNGQLSKDVVLGPLSNSNTHDALHGSDTSAWNCWSFLTTSRAAESESTVLAGVVVYEMLADSYSGLESEYKFVTGSHELYSHDIDWHKWRTDQMIWRALCTL